MARQQSRRKRAPSEPTPFEQARDELFQHIITCDVIGATEEHQADWFHETISYLGTRYPELTTTQLGELRTLGERFSKPPKAAAVPQPEDAASAA